MRGKKKWAFFPNYKGSFSPKLKRSNFPVCFYTKKKSHNFNDKLDKKYIRGKNLKLHSFAHMALIFFGIFLITAKHLPSIQGKGKEEKETAGPSSLDYWKSLEFLTSLSNRPTRKTTDLTKHVCNLTHMHCVKYTLTQSILSRRVTSEKLLFSFFFLVRFF